MISVLELMYSKHQVKDKHSQKAVRADKNKNDPLFVQKTHQALLYQFNFCLSAANLPFK